ncbi:hypothetical protein ACFVTM_08865 [Arthrobacter sp. NPDC058130]|uniref:DUF6414 family protein n=1 Tax=Arthrobacter sp. NPDC058130 TaxID=3346353 RepID=UPI0036E31F1F
MTSNTTSREVRLRETDRLLKRGLGYTDIAEYLGVKKRTVEEYAAELRRSPLPEESDVFSLVIYQNPEYVSALLQQLFAIGLPVEEFAETVNTAMRKSAAEAGAQVSGGFKSAIPFMKTGASADVNGHVKGSMGGEDKGEQRHHQKFSFTQANYLHNVRQALYDRELIQCVTGPRSLDDVEVGTFVEFSASFQANEINSILDLATPELVAAIVRHQHKKEALKIFNFQEGHDARQAYAMKIEIEANAKADLASAATIAVRQDFRNETTREYFGTIIGSEDGEDVTAVTICDTEYFLNQDKDRILDGTFKVLGKVTQVSYDDLSILSRNKFLNRMQQPMIDELSKHLKAASAAGQFDATLTLALEAPIIKVIPIAIYL